MRCQVAVVLYGCVMYLYCSLCCQLLPVPMQLLIQILVHVLIGCAVMSSSTDIGINNFTIL